MKRLWKLFRKKVVLQEEYVYLALVPMPVFDKEFKFDTSTEKRKQFIIQSIVRELAKQKKEIQYTDFLTDYASGMTYCIFSSVVGSNYFLMPLLYEIYAYRKLKDSSKFTYKHETKIYNEIKVLKFTIECYKTK